MTVSAVLDEKSMNNVGFAMECIAFSDEELDACLADMRQQLDEHVPGHTEFDPDVLRMGVAQGLALAGALKNINNLDALESLMLTVGFFGGQDADDLLLVKAITLDQALNEAVRIESEGNHPQVKSDCARLERVRASAGKVMLSRGIGESYYGRIKEVGHHEH